MRARVNDEGIMSKYNAVKNVFYCIDSSSLVLH